MHSLHFHRAASIFALAFFYLVHPILLTKNQPGTKQQPPEICGLDILTGWSLCKLHSGKETDTFSSKCVPLRIVTNVIWYYVVFSHTDLPFFFLNSFLTEYAL